MKHVEQLDASSNIPKNVRDFASLVILSYKVKDSDTDALDPL